MIRERIPVIDEDNILSKSDRERLGAFIIENCLCTVTDTEWLKHIIIRSDKGSRYRGYWTAQIEREDNKINKFVSIIVINSHYLQNVDDMEKVLAHEYGHNWTIGYLLHLERLEDKIKTCRVPWLYYRIRRMNSKKFVADYKKGWEYCDKEMLPEDYRILFTNYKDTHRMVDLIVGPSSEVAYYIKRLGKRNWR